MPKDLRIDDEPFDRLTEIAGELIRQFDQTATEPGDRCIVIVDSDDKTGMAISGFDGMHDVLLVLIAHLQAIFAVRGQRMDLMAVDDDGSARLVSTNDPATNQKETN